MKRLLGLLLGMVWGGGPLRKLGATIYPLVGKVTGVSLVDTQVTDVELVHLAGLTELGQLYLSNTQITDTGLVHIKGLASLEWLDLEQTKVTDAGLVHLKGLTNLKELALTSTKVTDEGVAELQKALPKCSIAK